MKEHPPGVIALPVTEHFRYSRSALSVMAVKRPSLSKVDMVIGMDVTLASNKMVEDALAEGFEWVWFQSDDHVYNDQILYQLLDREVDVIVPLIARRNPPYSLVIYKGEEWETLSDGQVTASYELFDPDEIPSEGIFEVHAAGTGGMLVRCDVFRSIHPPWFESSSGAFTNHDLEFCRKVRDAGFKIHADVECVMTHLSDYAVLPEYKNDRWGITLDFGNGTGSNRIWFGDDPRKVAAEQEARA